MEKNIKNQLLVIAKNVLPKDDIAHDFLHAKRVLTNALEIWKWEWADEDILFPAALFHDVIVYPKNHPSRHLSQKESADEAAKILEEITEYPKEKIENVKRCIMDCSFTKWVKHDYLEWKVLQDADLLEATWAISIMRTFSTTWQICRPFYYEDDPFCEKREPESLKYAIDLFYDRLLLADKRMYTKTWKKIARKRIKFLKIFLKQLETEIYNIDNI